MRRRRVVIAGAGIAGLAAAHRLNELRQELNLPLEITLLEAGPRAGGVIKTDIENGFLLESGPDSFITEKPWALGLCKRIGLENDLIPTNADKRRSFIYSKGKLSPVPAGFHLIAPSEFKTIWKLPFLSPLGKIRMALEFVVKKKPCGSDESIASFIRRRFGKEVLEKIGQPMIGGIFSGDPELLSLQACMPRLAEMEREQGSMIRALIQKRGALGVGEDTSGPRYGLFMSLRGGMGQLVNQLLSRMDGVRVEYNQAVASVEPSRNQWRVKTLGGLDIEADALLLALPAFVATPLLQPVLPDVAAQIELIPYESIATVSYGFKCSDLPRDLEGFGFVVPASEKRDIIGCAFCSVKYAGRAPRDHELLRVFVGGAFGRRLLKLEDEALEERVRAELRDILGIDKDPLFYRIARYPRSMPQYQVGHLDRMVRVAEFLEKSSGLYLTGNGYRGVGIPDCILDAERTAEAIAGYLFEESKRSVVSSAPGRVAS